jgi:hypothetical protein
VTEQEPRAEQALQLCPQCALVRTREEIEGCVNMRRLAALVVGAGDPCSLAHMVGSRDA